MAKDNSSESTLRTKTRPKSEPVRVAKETKGAGIRAAAKQNSGNVIANYGSTDKKIAEARERKSADKK